MKVSSVLRTMVEMLGERPDKQHLPPGQEVRRPMLIRTVSTRIATPPVTMSMSGSLFYLPTPPIRSFFDTAH